MIPILQFPLSGIGRIPGIYITQYFGQNPQMYAPYKGHMGIDFGCPTGTHVLAAHDGKVQHNENPGGYGHYIALWAPDKSFYTIYGHLQGFFAPDGATVHAGDMIAYSNNTGDSTGPHLHFGLVPYPQQFNNGYDGCIDPLPYMKGYAMLVFFQVKGQQTIWALMSGTWVGFVDLNAFNQYVGGRAFQPIQLDQTEFNKLPNNPDVFKT